MLRNTPPRRSLSPVDSARSSRSVAQSYLDTSKDTPSMSNPKPSRPGYGGMDFWMPKDRDVQAPSISVRVEPPKLMLPWTLPIPLVSEINLERFHGQFSVDGQHPSLIRQNLVGAIRQ